MEFCFWAEVNRTTWTVWHNCKEGGQTQNLFWLFWGGVGWRGKGLTFFYFLFLSLSFLQLPLICQIKEWTNLAFSKPLGFSLKCWKSVEPGVTLASTTFITWQHWIVANKKKVEIITCSCSQFSQSWCKKREAKFNFTREPQLFEAAQFVFLLPLSPAAKWQQLLQGHQCCQVAPFDTKLVRFRQKPFEKDRISFRQKCCLLSELDLSSTNC